jgi:EAL domain-containing protein (putative c-di-GMP-specific phosphodiesterase class I)
MADVEKAKGLAEMPYASSAAASISTISVRGIRRLSYLKRFPVDTLKVDKSFVRDMSDDSSDRTLVATVVAMARSLSMDVVAEGVESTSQLRLLRTMGCRYAQGYHFSRPLPVEEFETQATRINQELSAAGGV